MKTYDFTQKTWHNIIKPIDDTPCIYANDNLTVEVKQAMVSETMEWFYDVYDLIIAAERRNNVVYLEDYR